MNDPRNTFGAYDDNGPYPYPPYSLNEQGQPPPPLPLVPQRRASIFDDHIDKLQGEVRELRAQVANNNAELEALWNDSRGAPPNMGNKASIMLSRRMIALLESEIKEKEQEIRSLEALRGWR